MDFIPNHTGRDHPWFNESKQSLEHTNFYRNFYVWEGKVNALYRPNNWVCDNYKIKFVSKIQ